MGYTQPRIPGGVPIRPLSHPAFPSDENIVSTGDALPFATKDEIPTHPDNETPFSLDPTVQ